MNPWALLGIVLVVGAMTGGAYWQGRNDGANAEKASQQREEDVKVFASEAAASAIAAAIPKITVRHQTIKQELEREIRTNPVYLRADCDTGPDSLLRFNSAIPGAAAAPSHPGALPASGAGH